MQKTKKDNVSINEASFSTRPGVSMYSVEQAKQL